MHIPTPEQDGPIKVTYYKNQSGTDLLRDQVTLISMINRIVAACMTNDLKVEIRNVNDSTFSYSVKKKDFSSIITGEFTSATDINDLLDLICGRTTSIAQPPAMKTIDGREISYWRLVNVRQEDVLSNSNIKDNEYWVAYDEKGTECFRQLVGEKNEDVGDVAGVQYINMGDKGTCVFVAFKSEIEKARREQEAKVLENRHKEMLSVTDVEYRPTGSAPCTDISDC